jgi:phosphomannomutase
MAEELVRTGFEVVLSESYAPTPAFSWAAFNQGAGSLVITASHNPGDYLGLKVKGGFGGSVSPEITQQIEQRLTEPRSARSGGSLSKFDPWEGYVQEIKSKVDLTAIHQLIDTGKLKVFADVMHGAAATGLGRILGREIIELNSESDPLFNGNAPEPLARYTSQLSRLMRRYQRENPQVITVGFVFDGDSDRIAAIDSQGNFLSSQILIPILINHLAKRRGFTGEIVKTVSTINLVPKLAKLYGLPVYETPIGYKYIADRMLTNHVLIGGEESGGIGYGHHIPERDALLSALYLLEAIVMEQQDLGGIYHSLCEKTGYGNKYDRLDLHLANMSVRDRIVDYLDQKSMTKVNGLTITDCQTTDGYKLFLENGSWLLIRFSGTEPVLRLYCEAENLEQVYGNLNWAKTWASSF